MAEETETEGGNVEETGLSLVERTWLCTQLGKQLYNSGAFKLSEAAAASLSVDGDASNGVDQGKIDALRNFQAMTAEEKSALDDGQREELEAGLKAMEDLRLPLESLAEQAAEVEEREKRRAAKLEEMRNLIAIQKEEFAKRTDVTYEVSRKYAPGTKKIPAKVTKGQFVGLNLATSDSDEFLEYSQEHYKARTKELDPETKKLLDLVISQLELITKQLLDDEEIDLTPNDLMAELWTPLVREGIVSSDQCPSEFSRIMTLWKGASDLYKKRCEEKAREPEDSTAGAQAVIGDIDEVLGIGADIAGIALSVVGGEDSVKILKLVRTITHAGLVGLQKTLAMEFDKVGDSIGTIIEASLKQVGCEDLGKMISGGFKAAVNGSLMANALAKKDWDSAFGYLCSGLEGGFVAIDRGNDDGDAQSIGGEVVFAMQRTKNFGKIIYLMAQPEPDPNAIMAEMGEMVKEGINKGFEKKLESENEKAKNKALEEAGFEEGSDEAKAIEAKFEKDLEDQQAALTDITDTVQSEDGDAITGSLAGSLGFPKVEEGDEDKIMQDILQRTEKDAIEQAARDQETFERRIAIAFGIGAGADSEQQGMIEDLYDIDVLIAEIQASQARLQLFKTLLDAVSGVATMLVPQLGGPLKARQFAFDVAAAIQRTQELVKFKGLVSDAKKATSPQAHTLIAQVDELSHQLTNDIMEASFHLLEACTTTAAAACEVSGVAAPVGEALKIAAKGLEAMHSAKDFLYRKFKEKKTKRAWNQFRKAVDNPEDRRAIMKAFRKNPTLAKYGIAYGALEMGDSIAKESLRQCGLNDMVLASENTNATKVVRYLEAKYPDDIQVVGVLSKFAPDSGDPLSMQVWVANRDKAAEAGWATEPTTRIDAAIQQTKLAADAIESLGISVGNASADQLTSHWDKYSSCLKTLSGAFRDYEPRTIEGRAFDRFLQYLDELATAAEEKRTEVQDDIKLRQTAIKQEADGLTELKKQVAEAKQSFKDVIDGLTECQPEDNDTTGELAAQKIADFFASGIGKTATTAVIQCKKKTMIMTGDIDMFLKVTKLVVAKTSKDPVQVAGHINEAINRIRTCDSRIAALVTA